MMGYTPPSLFGRLTLVHAQHQSLAALLHRLDEAARTVLDLERRPTDPTESLHGLLRLSRLELEEHFAAEEGPAHFETISADRPSLLPAIVDLRADHAAMRDSLAHLDSLTRMDDGGESLAAGAVELVARFRVHERAEAAMLAEYLGEPEPPS